MPVSAADDDVFGFLIPNFYPCCFKFFIVGFEIYSFKSFKGIFKIYSYTSFGGKVPVTIGSANPCIDTLALKFSLNFCEVSLMQKSINISVKDVESFMIFGEVTNIV